MYVAEQPYQNGTNSRRASLDPGPPPPPTNESDWELHFCRWWGWNWVKRQNNVDPAMQKRRGSENDKEKPTKGSLCWKKKKDHDNLQMMYNTPSNSVINGPIRKTKPVENTYNAPVPNSNLRRSNESNPPVENLYSGAPNNGSRRNSPECEDFQEQLERQIIRQQLYEAPSAKAAAGKKKPRKEDSSTSSSCRCSIHKEFVCFSKVKPLLH